MAVLIPSIYKKVSASTLVETLVASVLIIVVFSMASLSLNSIIKSSLASNTKLVEVRIDQLFYFYKNGKISATYTETMGDWSIALSSKIVNNVKLVQIEASHAKTRIVLTKRSLDERVY